MPERRYDEQELAQILRAAAEVQSGASSEPDEPKGFTLSEIQRLAAEVGIAPENVARATETLGSRPKPAKFLPFGAPAREQFEGSIEGELSDQTWEDLVSALRSEFGYMGSVSSLGSCREWSGGEDISVHFSAAPRNGRTRFSLTLRQTSAIVVAWFLGLTVGFLGTLAIGVPMGRHGAPALEIIVSVLALYASIYLVLNRTLASWHKRRLGRARALMDRVKGFAAPSQSNLPNAHESSESLSALDQPKTLNVSG